MARLAPSLVLIIALALCAWTLAEAQEETDETEATPTPTPESGSYLDMPTPVPLDEPPATEADLYGMPTPIPAEGEEPTDLYGMPTPIPAEGEEPTDLYGMPTPIPAEGEPTQSVSEPSASPASVPAPAPAPLSRSVKFEGQAALKSAADTYWDIENEDVWANYFYGYAEASANWGTQFSALASGLFEYRYDIGDEATGEAVPELRELFGKFSFGSLDLFVGQQIVSWGVTDGINPLDQLNPFDYSRAIDIDLNYARMGTFMIRPVLYLGDFQIEAAYIPLFTPPRYDIVGSDWALSGQSFPLGDLLRELRTEEDWRNLERFVAFWVPEWRDDVRDLVDNPDFFITRTDIPDQDLTAPEGAIRVKWSTPKVDFYAAYLALWDDIPTLHVNPGLRDLEKLLGETDQGYAQLIPPDEYPIEPITDLFTLTHHRVQTAGLGFSGTAGDFGVRGEGAYHFGRYTYRTDMTAVKRNSASWVLNADYTFPHNVLVSALLIQSYLVDREDDFISRGWQHMAGVIWQTDFLDARLALEGLALLDLTYLNGADWRRGDFIASGWSLDPMLTYTVTDPLKVSIGANLFGGRDNTPLGYLQGNSRVFGLVRYGF